jgi:hypothetical protein
MKIQFDEEHGQVTVTTDGGAKVTMSRADYEAKVATRVDWYDKKKRREMEAAKGHDKYHGQAAEMYDPDAPYTQTFNPRYSPRGKGSGSVNGPVITAANYWQVKFGIK